MGILRVKLGISIFEKNIPTVPDGNDMFFGADVELKGLGNVLTSKSSHLIDVMETKWKNCESFGHIFIQNG